MKIFAQRLKEQITRLGLSNAQAARRVGIFERRFNNYSNDEREPDLATLAKIAVSLETSVDVLLGIRDVPERNEWQTLLDRLTSAARALPKEELEIMTIQVEAVAAKHRKPSSPDL